LLLIWQHSGKKQEKYRNIVDVADNYFSQQNYNNAKTEYTRALEIFPLEKYPQQKINEADSILDEIARLEQLEITYNNTIQNADQLLEEEQYSVAMEEYKKALELKPKESYPQLKITAIEEILAEIARLEQIANEYERLVASAERLLEEEKYEESKTVFAEALEIKPGEQYPAQKINEIDIILQRLEEEREEAYNYAITRGDNLFSGENYEEAKEAYITASNLMPDEIYPREKIDECNGIIAEIRLANQKAYDQAIADADKFYNSRVYDKAIGSYLKAEELLPDETYPREMINKITKMIRDNLLVDINTEYTTIMADNEVRFEFEPIPIQKRKDNYILIKARNISGNEFKVIFSYGIDGGKNGGSLLRIPAGETEQDYLIRIGTQYKWFSEDNNWVSLYPEGGDIEVSLIRVSKAE
jgi:tetratricopeptide (TPR) repeat protein